jgi:glycosyltransferase involved in cell wall biosynthesis
MRIAFDARSWEKPPHSFSRVLRLLFLSARRMEWEVELWTEGELQPDYQRYRSMALRAKEARNRTRAHVLWSPHHEFLPSGLPAVATVHDINPLLPDNRGRAARWLRAVRFRSQIQKTFDRAWRVATDSRDSRERITEAFPGQDHKLNVVSLFVDPELKRPGDAERDACLAELGLSPGYIFFLGSLRRHKNWDGLIRAYAALPEPLKKNHPLVLGGPSKRAGKRAVKLARALGVEDRVILPGMLPENRIPFPVRGGGPVRLSQLSGGVRAASARGHGVRHAGGLLRPDIPPGNPGRGAPVRGSLPRGARSPGPWSACFPTPPAGPAA